MDAPGPPPIISITIKPTSMTVTATASTSEPSGSPTRCAITSAWCTAAKMAPTRNADTTARISGPSWWNQATAKTANAATGTTSVHCSDPRHALGFMRHTLGDH